MTKTKELEIFSQIQDPELDRLLDPLPSSRYPKDFLIYETGDRSAQIYGLLEGSVEIRWKSTMGETTPVRTVTPGETFGEFPYFTGSPQSSEAVATEDVTLVEISNNWLNNTLLSFPILREHLLRVCRTRVLSDVLHQTQLFSSLSPKQLSQLVQHFELRRFNSGETLISEGDSGLDLFILQRGKVLIHRATSDQPVALAELGPGDVLGEMAIVTGEPRSASATAQTVTEAMVLSGPKFKKILENFPSILQVVEEMVRCRGSETRKALEAVVSDLVEGEWPADDEDDAGIFVTDLHLQATFKSGETNGTGSLQRLSQSRMTLTLPQDAKGPAAEQTTQISLKRSAEEETFSGKTLPSEPGSLTIQLDRDDITRKRATTLLTDLASARLRLFIFPDYDVTSLNIEANLQIKGLPSPLRGKVQRISQTTVRIKVDGKWEIGSLTHVTLTEGAKELCQTKILPLSCQGDLYETTLEYETRTEKELVRGLVQDIARRTGFAAEQTATPAAPTNVASKAAQLLNLPFRTGKEFTQTFMSSMEAGYVRVPTKETLPKGAPVRVKISVPIRKTRRTFLLQGKVKRHHQGKTVVELNDSQDHLRSQLARFCNELVSEKTHESWKERKGTLARKGTLKSKRKATFWVEVAAYLFFIVSAFYFWQTFKETPTTEVTPAVSPAPSAPGIKKVKREPRRRLPTARLKHVGAIKRRSSTRQEKGNIQEEPLTKKQVQEQITRLEKGIGRKLAGARATLQHEKDPKKRQAIENQIRSVESGLRKLQTVNPNDQSTWYFLDGKKARIEISSAKEPQ